MAALVLLLIVVVAGSAGMVAVLGWLHQRIARLEEGGSGRSGGAYRLTGETEDLREQVRLLEVEMERMTERLDFTEKLLERPRHPGEDPDRP